MFDQFLHPDLQAILLFLLPTLVSLSFLVMNMSRGFSTAGVSWMVFFAAVAVYFAPGMIAVL